MENNSVNQQINHLRVLVDSNFINLHKWLILVSFFFLFFSAFLWHPIPLMAALFFGVFGFIIRRAGPNVVAALRAYDTTKASKGKVVITILCWSDSNHYYAKVQDIDHVMWEYEFCPIDWKPIAGTYDAFIWRSSKNGAPVLTIIENGIMVPNNNPKNIKTT